MDSRSKYNIYPITPLSSFINKYPDQRLHQNFKILQQEFPSHRAVKGDGNCFYRAFAFLYLANNPCQSFYTTFPKTTWNYIKDQSYINSDQKFQQQLKKIWDKYVSQLNKAQNRTNKQKKLQSLFNGIGIFDQLMIGYFRSANYQHMKQNKQSLLPFSRSQEQYYDQLQRVKTFGAESQGAEISSLADAMKTKITIYAIGQNSFQPIHYMDKLQDKGFYFFYRPGHYDIVYPYQVTTSTPMPKKQGLLSNLTTQFRTVLPFSASQKKQQQSKQNIPQFQYNLKIQKPNNSTTQSKLVQNTQSTKRKIEKKISQQNENINKIQSTNDGKYDIQFRTQQKNRNSSKLSNSSDRIMTVKRSSVNPKVINSWGDPFEKLFRQLFALFALFLGIYMAYRYFS